MPKPYSVDLRARVIEDVETGASRREAAERYGNQPQRGGDLGAAFRGDRQRCGKAKRRQHLAAGAARGVSAGSLGLIANQPDLTLNEIVAAMRKRRIAGSRSAVWRFFARRNISFKKNSVRGGAEACGRSPPRRRWMREQGMFNPARLVFIDETCTTTAMVRLRGRAPRGERLVDYAPHGHWKTISFVGRPAATRHDRTICARGSHERADVSRLCEAMPCPDPSSAARSC